MFDQSLPTNLFNVKAIKAADALSSLLSGNSIKLESDLISGLRDVIQQISVRSLAPSMEQRQPTDNGLLIREDVTVPLDGAVLDIASLYDASSLLRTYVLDSTNLLLSEIRAVDGQLQTARDRLAAYRLSALESSSKFFWIGDTLTTRDSVDPTSTAQVHTQGGFITLGVIEEVPLSSLISKVYVDGATAREGLAIPGNNMEIRDFDSIPEGARLSDISPEPQPVLYKDTATIDNIAAIFDGNPTTYFELESYYAPRNQRLAEVGTSLVHNGGGSITDVFSRTQGYGWRVNVRWGADEVDRNNGNGYPLVNFYSDSKPFNARPVRLGLTVELDSSHSVSLIALTPMIREGKFPYLASMEISRDGSQWFTVEAGSTLTDEIGENSWVNLEGIPIKSDSGTKFWNVSNDSVKYIRLVLSQGEPYQCYLGHRYYAQMYDVKSNTKVLGFTVSSKHSTDWKRLADPEIPQVGNVSVNDPSLALETIGYALGGPLWGAIGSALYGKTKTEEPVGDVKEGYDIIDGMRYAVGIRDLLILSHRYAAASQLVSKPVHLPAAARAVSLYAGESVPEAWGPGDWIRYEISLGGGTWMPIVPVNRGGANEDTVLLANGATTAQIRITLSRPNDRECESPIVTNYALKFEAV